MGLVFFFAFTLLYTKNLYKKKIFVVSCQNISSVFISTDYFTYKGSCHILEHL